MLTASDFYDLLAAQERTVEEARRAARQLNGDDGSPNSQLRERYLQHAANLGLLPAQFSTPPAVTLASDTTLKAHSSRRPWTASPPGLPSVGRGRAMRALAQADAECSSSAAAALAATEALTRPRRPRQNLAARLASSSNSGSEDDGSGSEASSSEGLGGGGGLFGNPRKREGRTVQYARKLNRIVRGKGGQASEEPTAAFLRTWRAMKAREALRKQVVRFLVHTPGELEGEVPTGGATASPRPSMQGGPGRQEWNGFSPTAQHTSPPGPTVSFGGAPSPRVSSASGGGLITSQGGASAPASPTRTSAGGLYNPGFLVPPVQIPPSPAPTSPGRAPMQLSYAPDPRGGSMGGARFDSMGGAGSAGQGSSGGGAPPSIVSLNQWAGSQAPPGSAGAAEAAQSFGVIRENQSNIERDVAAVMQRLADIKGKLGGGDA